jgi:spore germination cell wall hydrolase CwlJ-like protein
VGKKLTYILAFAGLMALAHLAAPTRAYAPAELRPPFQPPKERVIIAENPLEKITKEAETNIKKIERKVDMLSRYETDSFYDDETYLLVARLMLGEDEGHSDISKIADASTALNRAKRNNTDIRTEILRPWAYSCFWREDSKTFLKTPLDHSPLKYTQEFPIDLELARNFLDGKYKDPTHGATSYYNPNGLEDGIIRFVKGLGKIETPRDWDMNSMIYLAKIGDHYYFKEKN